MERVYWRHTRTCKDAFVRAERSGDTETMTRLAACDGECQFAQEARIARVFAAAIEREYTRLRLSEGLSDADARSVIVSAWEFAETHSDIM